MIFRDLTIRDLRSLADLKIWVKNTTGKFTEQDISKANMLIILEYLKECIAKSELTDKGGWNQLLNTLIRRAEVLDE